MGQTIAIDFDGVLADPIHPRVATGAVGFLKRLHESGHRIVVHSCRDGGEIVEKLQQWGLARYVHQVTDIKPNAWLYIDDRAITHRGSFQETLAAVESFRPWWEAGLPILNGEPQ